MALVSIAVFDTPENGRASLTAQTLIGLHRTVDFRRHRLVVVDNGSTCPRTREMLDRLEPGHTPFGEWASWVGTLPPATVVHNAENRGTARAVNQGWLLAGAGDCVVKMDNDCSVAHPGWLDLLEECVARDPQLGIVGLKRPDLEERPGHDNPCYRSELKMLPHKPGERWLVVEKVRHALGTCLLFAPALRERIGFLYQMGYPYAFDDSLAAYRCEAAGFYSAFLAGPELSHLDPGGNDFTAWKQRVAGEAMRAYNAHRAGYAAGVFDPYHGPDDAAPRLTAEGQRLRAEGSMSAEWLRLIEPGAA